MSDDPKVYVGNQWSADRDALESLRLEVDALKLLADVNHSSVLSLAELFRQLDTRLRALEGKP